MSANRRHVAIGTSIATLIIVETIWVYPSLPEPMASTFGGDGEPVAWASKATMLAVFLASMLFWTGGLLLVPKIAGRARPNLDDAMRLWLRDHLGRFFVVSLAFSAATTHMVYEANLGAGRLSTAFIACLVVYLPFVLVWTISLVRRVKR